MNAQNPVRISDAHGDVYKSAGEILENLKSLGPLIEQEAEEINRIRHLTPKMLDALRQAGAFRIAWPAAWGGPEMRFDDQIRAVASLSYYDASVAWNVQILSDTGFYGAQFSESTARELYGSMDFATAGGFFPPQRADRVPGGWHIPKGRWPFGSGIHSADCIVCGIHLYENGQPLCDEHGKPEFRVAYLPKDKVELLDTWYTLGLQGSGSTDYQVENVTVPDKYVFKYFSGAASHLPPLARHADFIAISLQGVVLGLGRRILDDVRSELMKRSPNDRFIRIQYAEAEMNYNAARTFALAAAGHVSDKLFAGETLTAEEEAMTTLSSVNAGHQIRKACAMALELLGASIIYQRSPFERRRRDLDTLMVHLGHQRRALEAAGGSLLGEGNLPQLA
jgi:indole-3-acetate monooxygenase